MQQDGFLELQAISTVMSEPRPVSDATMQRAGYEMLSGRIDRDIHTNRLYPMWKQVNDAKAKSAALTDLLNLENHAVGRPALDWAVTAKCN